MQPALVSWQNWRGCATGDLGNGTDVVQHAEGPRYHKAKLGARVLQVGVCIRVFMPVCFFACSLVLPSDPISPALVLANIEPITDLASTAAPGPSASPLPSLKLSILRLLFGESPGMSAWGLSPYLKTCYRCIYTVGLCKYLSPLCRCVVWTRASL